MVGSNGDVDPNGDLAGRHSVRVTEDELEADVDPLEGAVRLAEELIAVGRGEEAANYVADWILPVLERRVQDARRAEASGLPPLPWRPSLLVDEEGRRP